MPKLNVCKKCGWYEHESSLEGKLDWRGECDPKRGAAADMLMKSLPDVKSTKLGYGFGRVTFEFSERSSVTFEVYADGSFGIDHVYLLDDFTQSEASEFIRAFKAKLPAS